MSDFLLNLLGLGGRRKRDRDRPGISDPSVIPSDDPKLTILLMEYDRLTREFDSAHTEWSQIFSLAILILGGVGGFLIGGKLNEYPYVVAAAPAVILVIYAYAVDVRYRWAAHLYQIRIVIDRLVQLSGERAYVFLDHSDSIPSRFHSLKSGNAKPRGMTVAMFAVIALFLIFLILYSFDLLYQNNHLIGVIFLVFYTLMFLFLLWGFIGTMRDLPDLFDRVSRQVKLDPNEPTDIRAQVGSGASLFQVLLPKASDFVTKSWMVLAGLASIWWVSGPEFNPRIDDLFTTGNPASKGNWTLIAFAICWWLVQEGLIQQAKFTWNAIRDRKEDSQTPGKEERPYASGDISAKSGVGHLVVRWSVGLLLGVFLDYRLFALLLIISVVQILYDLWAKPISARNTQSQSKFQYALILVALGASIRVLGGMLSVSLGFPDSWSTLLIAFFFFFGTGYTATCWRIDVEEARKRKTATSRPQIDLFLKKGMQRFGFSGALLCAIAMLAESLLSSKGIVGFDRLLEPLRPLIPNLPSWADFGMKLSVAIAVGALLTVVVFIPLSGILRLFSKCPPWAKVLVLVALVVPIAVAFPDDLTKQAAASIVWVIISILAFGAYDKMDYDNFYQTRLKRCWKCIMLLWFFYLFNANTGLTIGKVQKLASQMIQRPTDKAAKDLRELADRLLQESSDPVIEEDRLELGRRLSKAADFVSEDLETAD